MKTDWKVYTLESLDKEKWDQLIYNSDQGNFYNQTSILECLPGKPIFYVKKDYSSGICLPFKNFGPISRIVQPPFIQQLGFISKGKFDIDPYILSKLKRSKIPILRQGYHFNQGNIDLDFGPLKPQIKSSINLVLELSKSLENIRSSYSTNLKRNLKKGLKNEISIEDSISIDDFMGQFFLNMNSRIKSVNPPTISMLKRMLINLKASGQISLLTASKHSETLGGIALGRFKERTTYWLGFSSQKGLEYGAMPLLLDKGIENASKNCTEFDFEGGNLEGTRTFFEQFKPEQKPFPVLIW